MPARRLRALLAVGLLPAGAWALLLGVQQRGFPDRALRLDPLELSAPTPGAAAVAGIRRQGSLWLCPPAAPALVLETHFVVQPAQLDSPHALYLPAAEGRLEVWLDGRPLTDGAEAVMLHRPRLISIPAALLRAEGHRLRLRLAGEGDAWGRLSPVYLGPMEHVEPAFRWRWALKVTSLQLAFLGMLGAAGAALAVARRRPRDVVYAWFGAGLLCWSVYNLHYLLAVRTLPRPLWQTAIHAALGGFLHCMILFVHRLLDLRHERGERWLARVSVAALLVLALGWAVLSDAQQWRLINRGYRFLLLALGAYLAKRLLVVAVRRGGSGPCLLAGSACLTLSLGVHDSVHQLGLIAASDNLLQYGVPAMLVVFGALAVERFAGALGQSEALSASLDRRVRAQVQAMAEQHERARSLEHAMVLAAERERLVRDMHDGLGGQLVALLTLARSGRGEAHLLERGLADALLDLRLVIDSLDTAGEDLAVGLGMLRSRLDPRLQAVGLRVHWDLYTLPAGLRLGPEAVLQVLRIVQEAAQNTLRHARADSLWITARLAHECSPPCVRLSVRDDGCGLPADAPAGRGLRHMRRRAQRLDATLDIGNVDPGTCVTLCVPLPARRVAPLPAAAGAVI